MSTNGRVVEHRPGHYRVGRSGFRRAIVTLFDTALTFQTRLSGSEWAETLRHREQSAVGRQECAICERGRRLGAIAKRRSLHAGCSAERSQGLRAKRSLQELLDTGPVTITRQTATRGRNRGKPRLDKYGRTLGVFILEVCPRESRACGSPAF